MHIKSVVVCGFRSYKEEAVVESFSKGQNVVIGRNGTGKSNMFDAIRFGLLTERFSNLRQEERQGLLHEGAGKHVMSAYVEITFCNRDGRLPLDTEDVVLRRTIGVKKDEFFLNRKHITKQDVHHLLESAGFSRSNPYYIVQQGKVNALALMKDKDRLELLKDVAGTKVYEDRRVESLKIIQESQSRREKILEVISYIEGRLNELEEEKDELKEYQELDKEKRALEYMMHEKELQSVRMELEAIERSRVEEASMSNDLHAKERDISDLIKQSGDNIHRISEDKDNWNREKAGLEAERADLMQVRYALEMEVKELTEGVAQDKSTSKALAKEMATIQGQCTEIENELADQWTPKFQELTNTLKDTKQSQTNLALEADSLVSKKSRKSQFKSQKDRDAFLSSEIKELSTLVKRKEKETASFKHSIATSEHQIHQARRDLEEQSEAMGNYRQQLENYAQSLLELKEKRNSVSETRKDRWREENNISQEVKRVSEQLQKSESVLHSTMAYDVRRGLKVVQEWRDSGKFRGIYGPLIELVEPVDDRFCIAIDEAAGGSFFHVVVDTDETATRIMRELEKNNLGRVTFLPLNRLKVSDDTSYITNDDVMPLMDKLNFSRDIRKAVLTAFGKKLLCRDLDTCAEYAERTDMDCLTLDGDMVHRRGGLNGGYKDPKRSRSRAQMEVKAAEKRLDAVNQEAKKVRYAAQQADQHVSSVMGEIQKQESEKQHALDSYEQLQKDHERLQQQIAKNEDNVEEKKGMLQTWAQEIQDLEAKRSTLENEMSQKMQDSLSAQDAHRLEELQGILTELKTHERHQRQELEAVRSKKSNLEAILKDNLHRRLKEIQNQIEVSSVWSLHASERKTLVEMKTVDLQEATRTVERHDAQWKELDNHVSQCEMQLQREQQTLEKQKQQLSNIKHQLADETTKADRILTKRRRLLQKREDAMRDIRELGTLPTSELEKFKSCSAKEISKKFTKCTDKLKSYAHVNKKALDQYVSFSEQRSALISRKEELDAGDESIKELIDVLDRRKDEAILRTFKGVSHHFTQVFRELVPTGEGKMLILRGEDSANETDTTTFVGVQIKVNFRGEGDSYLMSQLSGGQKALVALAFIFAIQRCDPAPFYLFDEIDQALDSTHRAAVAALIQRQAHSDENPAQFITSTFRPELVSVADQFYGISHQNKISNIQPMTKEESLAFIADIMASEEAVENQ
ncbi:Aste57867_25208 [Aphanomyces stellatus]|uniref:Structural maintenance of chromosomes protein n=1 Tax=Aphanomyces stellatus TaxID=120398 RepID=A0A485LTG7_9STRA|nr:hypothetical protein As57867_025130 [Aphanomyces stellatus]VFU01835.1 Aste57867_25208 [Aphanomyces stellatus]